MRCKNCKEKFIVKYFLQKYCMEKDECIKAFNETVKVKDKKEWSKEKAKIKKSLMTKPEWMNLLQVAFNTFIRIRDKDELCISCDCNMQGRKGDASHFYPTTYSFLRFNEDNVHLSCVTCNQYKRGNLHEYRPRLIKKIGLQRVEWLDKFAHSNLELDIIQIQEMIKEYKQKIKDLK